MNKTEFLQDADIHGKYGDALIPKGKTALEINPQYFSAKMIKRYKLIFLDDDGWFEWRPDGWVPGRKCVLRSRIADLIQDEVRANFTSRKKHFLQMKPRDQATPAYDLINTHNIEEILRTMKYMCTCGKTIPPLDPDVIPVQNGILRWDEETQDFVFQDHYTPNDLIFTRLNVAYDSNADMNFFLARLAEILPDVEDQRVVQEYFGAAVFVENHTRRFLLFQGEGGCGKSILVEFLTIILTWERTFDLDFKSLHGNYAFSALTTQTLLTASEAVSEAFCQSAGIEFVKKAVGGDYFATSQKYRNQKVGHHGLYSLIIVSNNKLKFKYDGRGDEFKDRLIPILFSHHIENRNLTLIDTLMRDHRSAFLNWLLDGARRVRKNNWDIQLSKEQAHRRDRLIHATRGIDLFINNCIVAAPSQHITTEEAFNAYTYLSRTSGFESLDETIFQRRFSDAMSKKFGSIKAKNLPDSNGKYNARGYKGVAFTNKPSTLTTNNER